MTLKAEETKIVTIDGQARAVDQLTDEIGIHACDEIVDATGDEKSELTSPDAAERYFRETGVDYIVANLGTEHRASAADLSAVREAASAQGLPPREFQEPVWPG